MSLCPSAKTKINQFRLLFNLDCCKLCEFSTFATWSYSSLLILKEEVSFSVPPSCTSISLKVVIPRAFNTERTSRPIFWAGLPGIWLTQLLVASQHSRKQDKPPLLTMFPTVFPIWSRWLGVRDYMDPGNNLRHNFAAAESWQAIEATFQCSSASKQER